MERAATCHLCGDPIDPGQAWLSADLATGPAAAHAGCVYREEPTATEPVAWEPQESERPS